MYFCPVVAKGVVSGLCLVFAKYWYDRREERREHMAAYRNGEAELAFDPLEHAQASVVTIDVQAAPSASSTGTGATTEALSEHSGDAGTDVFAASDVRPAAGPVSGKAGDTVAADSQAPVAAAIAEAKRDRTRATKDDKQRVEKALASGDLSAMDMLLVDISDPELRNRLLNRLVASYYRLRAGPSHRAAFYRLAYLQIEEAPRILEGIKEIRKPGAGQIAGFKSMAIALNEDGRHDAAIAVCELALSLGLKDGTKAGFNGRIRRLKRSLARSGGVYLGRLLH